MLWFVAAIVMLGLLIFVHELGHFLAFKIIGVKVLKFSLGFDPVMVKKQIGETSYQVGWIPLGGYVRPLGEQDDDEVAPEDRGRAVPDKPLYARAFAFAAGPLMNLVFPLLIFWLVYALPGEEFSSRIGMTVDGMPAAAAGIVPGDRIVEVDGRPVTYFSEVQEAISSRPGRTFSLTVERLGRRTTAVMTAEAVKESNKLGEEWAEGRIGISPQSLEARVYVTGPALPAGAASLKSWDLVLAVNGVKVADWLQFKDRFEAAGAGPVELRVARRAAEAPSAVEKAKKDSAAPKTVEVVVRFTAPGSIEAAGIDYAGRHVRDVEPGSPADTAGVRPGDKVVAVDGRPVGYWGALEDVLRRDPSRTFEIGFEREGRPYTVRVALAKRTEKDEFKQEYVYYTFGARSEMGYSPGEIIRHPFQPLRGIREAFKTTGELIRITYVAVYRLATGKLSLKTVGGPIMIFDMAGTVAKRGAASYFWFMGLISINLGIFNLLPIPILDGGHLLLAAIEAALRRPLPRRARVISSYVGLAFLGAMIILVFKNDIERYWDSITGFFR